MGLLASCSQTLEVLKNFACTCGEIWHSSGQAQWSMSSILNSLYSPFLYQFDWRLTEELVRQKIDLSHSVSQTHRQLLPEEHVRRLLTCIIPTWKSSNQKHKQLRKQEGLLKDGKVTKKCFIIHTWNLSHPQSTEKQLFNQAEGKPKKKNNNNLKQCLLKSNCLVVYVITKYYISYNYET